MSPNAAQLCAIVIAKEFNELLQKIQQSQNKADMLELRLDWLKKINSENLADFRKHCTLPTIITCRGIEQGGKFLGSIEQQQLILQAANDAGFEYVDIDIAIAEKIVLTKQKTKKIISYHDFCSTPSLQELAAIKKEMQSNGAEIMKFAVQTHTTKDVNILMQFLLNKTAQEKMIVLGMGKSGRISRLLSPLLGGYLTFCCDENTESQVGALDCQEMKALFKAITNFVSANG